MRTEFMRRDAPEESDGSFKFFNWAILVVAAGLLIAATSEFAPKQDTQTVAAHAPATTVVQTVTPPKT